MPSRRPGGRSGRSPATRPRKAMRQDGRSRAAVVRVRPSRALRHVRQANLSTGCGPACVAIVARCSYATAVRAMFPDGRRTNLLSSWGDIRLTLDALGIRYAARAVPCTRWDRIPSVAIVGCGRRPGNLWHWVVYDPERRLVHDPLRSAGVSSARIRRKPFSYLAIEPPR